jgi:hypothetical protein
MFNISKINKEKRKRGQVSYSLLLLGVLLKKETGSSALEVPQVLLRVDTILDPLLGNLQPLITQSLLPGATRVYGHLL